MRILNRFRILQQFLFRDLDIFLMDLIFERFVELIFLKFHNEFLEHCTDDNFLKVVLIEK